MITKTCSTCAKTKAICEFHRRSEGYRAQCVDCRKRKPSTKKYPPAYRRLPREQYLANRAVETAVLRRKIAKPKQCENCKADTQAHRLHGHHFKGYAVADRLEIIWLCAKCHIRLHRQRPTAPIPLPKKAVRRRAEETA